MARPKKAKPSYCRDKSSDRGFVTLNGKRKYLGPPGSYGSQASHDEYDRVVGEWIAAGRQGVPASDGEPSGITVEEIIAAFWNHATTYYASCVRPDGKFTGELECYRCALKPLRRLYGSKPAAEFGPLALKTLRGEMIKLGWCRNVINRQILRIKSAVKWAVGDELLPASVYEGLRAVAGLRSGKRTARETEGRPLLPNPDAAEP